MNTEFLLIGQGISGTLLSVYLRQAGSSFMVIDKADPASATRAAAGLINPVTGRRIVQTWMIDQLLPFALNSYQQLGETLGIKSIQATHIADQFPSAQMLLAFRERLRDNAPYLSFPDDPDKYRDYFRYDFGFGEIAPCYVINLPELLPAWRRSLLSHHELREEEFNLTNCIISESGIQYQDIHAEKIIFCDGICSQNNPYFKNLPFALNKGEALLIETVGLPNDVVFKKALNMVPIKDNLFWAGSSYEWNFADHHPSALFLQRTTALLQHWLKMPFTIVDHIASVRPATLERRPFVGMHPHFPRIGIFNGMGTKGCSLAPYFANAFVNHLTKNSPIPAEADIHRFSRILKVAQG